MKTRLRNIENKVRKELPEGITLIALVITIIVLLILVAVSIATLTGENGILKQTDIAVGKYDKEEAREKLQLAITNLTIDKKDKRKLQDINEFDNTESSNYQKDIKLESYVEENDKTAKLIVDDEYIFYINEQFNINEIIGWDGVTISEGLYGLGTEEKPFLIQSAPDLVYMRNQVNSSGNTIYSLTDNNNYQIAQIAYYELTDDIYLNTYEEIAEIKKWDTNPPKNEWIPIGENNDYKFSGVFNGNGYHLIGFYINGKENENYKAIFGITEDAIIKNLDLVDSYIKGGHYIAGIVSDLRSTNIERAIVDNCSLRGNSYIIGVGGNTETFGKVGGIVGCAGSGGNVYNCYNTSKGYVKFEGMLNPGNPHGFVGGIIGGVVDDSTLWIGNCYNACDVTTIFKNKANFGATGGIVGQYAQNSQIYNSYNTGEITCLQNDTEFKERVGGIAGLGSKKYNCYDFGTVNGVKSTETKTKEELKEVLNDWVEKNNSDNKYKKWTIINEKNDGYPVLAAN